ncbi:MAG: type II toxin-antitoxin system mRNA interferase toxin, RelE/StbE family [Deltaproteobacteria bacterium]|nr:type II toxin-antitoxin system mRNA interferase toxin, RelE/StbE family [Deltaproteobacteria bacterium]MBW2331795.1 type II toxin-antitoxin system mRNA interferase toxin, RelE/StbE family [Deltaproteobacteria bacterium]
MEAVWDEGFKKCYRKRIRQNAQLKKKFWKKMGFFLSDPFMPPLRTHKLSGKLAGQWAFSVDNNWRVIFEFIGEDRVLLIDIGTHDEVY